MLRARTAIVSTVGLVIAMLLAGAWPAAAAELPVPQPEGAASAQTLGSGNWALTALMVLFVLLTVLGVVVMRRERPEVQRRNALDERRRAA